MLRIHFAGHTIQFNLIHLLTYLPDMIETGFFFLDKFRTMIYHIQSNP